MRTKQRIRKTSGCRLSSLVEFAHAMIDAGADMVVGRGLHPARHRGLQGQADLLFAREFHFRERSGQACSRPTTTEQARLSNDSLPSDYFSKRSKNDTVSFPADHRVLAVGGSASGLRQRSYVAGNPLASGVAWASASLAASVASRIRSPAAEADQIFKDLSSEAHRLAPPSATRTVLGRSPGRVTRKFHEFTSEARTVVRHHRRPVAHRGRGSAFKLIEATERRVDAGQFEIVFEQRPFARTNGPAPPTTARMLLHLQQDRELRVREAWARWCCRAS